LHILKFYDHYFQPLDNAKEMNVESEIIEDRN
jgi:hypothetical protein